MGSTVRVYWLDERGKLDPDLEHGEVTPSVIPILLEHKGKRYDLLEVIASENIITKEPDYFCYFLPQVIS